MKVIGVRVAGTHKAVGIFWGRDWKDLFFRIDECAAPGECEYLSLQSGGIFCSGEGPNFPVFGLDNDDDEPLDTSFNGVDSCNSTYEELLGGYRDHLWKPFPMSFEEAYADLYEASRQRLKTASTGTA